MSLRLLVLGTAGFAALCLLIAMLVLGLADESEWREIRRR